MKKTLLIFFSVALFLPSIASACYIAPDLSNIFLSGLIGLVVAIILTVIIHKKLQKLFIKKYKYYLVFLPMYIIITIALIYISIFLTPLDTTTMICGDAMDPQLPDEFLEK